MKTTKMWLLAILFLAFAATSCEEEDPPIIEEDPINEAQVLAEYLESPDGGGDYANTAMGAYVGADGVKALMATGGVYIIDIRSAETFASGHIEGAMNVAAADVISHLDGMDVSGYDKVAIVCYTGQSAAWVTNLARISGYDNVFSMKWGMSSWHADFDSWTGKTSNMYSTQFTNTPAPKGEVGNLPSLSTGMTEGADILDAGAAAIGAGDVYANLDDYHIVNYWKLEHYDNPGHIEGAMQYEPKASIGLDTYLKTLPTDKTIVVYCYTGQTSANLASYLRVLGYDAKSLKFGCNSMIYDEMPTAKWSEAQIWDYAYVTPSPAK